MDPLDFGGKKFRIEIDSSIIWREEFRTRVPPQLLAERATAQPTADDHDGHCASTSHLLFIL